MISAKSRKLLSESRQRIIAVTTNLFNSSCTFLRFIYSIPFNLLNIRCTFSILHGCFSLLFRYCCTIPFRTFEYTATWFVYESRIHTCWFHSKHSIKFIHYIRYNSMYFVLQSSSHNFSWLALDVFSFFPAFSYYFIYYSVGFTERTKWTNTN